MSDTIESVEDFIEIYKGKSIEEIYASPDLPAHLEILKTQIGDQDSSDTDPHMREKLEGFLTKLSQGITVKIADLQNDMQDSKDKIQSAQRNSEACIAYLKGQKT